MIAKILIGLSIILSCAAVGNYLLSPPLPFTFPAAVRLDFMGKGTCSGVVISNFEALTAAHCLFRGPRPYLGPILVINSKKKVTVAFSKGAIKKLDLGYIVGDFRKFEKAKASVKHSKLETDRTYLTCGYPMGQTEQVCDELVIKGNHLTYKWGVGNLIYGQSGGPVIDPRTGTVEGLNSHIYQRVSPYGVTLEGVGVTPLTGIFGRYGIRRAK